MGGITAATKSWIYQETLTRCSDLCNTYAWEKRRCVIPSWSGVITSDVLQDYGTVLRTHGSQMDCGIGA